MPNGKPPRLKLTQDVRPEQRTAPPRKRAPAFSVVRKLTPRDRWDGGEGVVSEHRDKAVALRRLREITQTTCDEWANSGEKGISAFILRTPKLQRDLRAQRKRLLRQRQILRFGAARVQSDIFPKKGPGVPCADESDCPDDRPDCVDGRCGEEVDPCFSNAAVARLIETIGKRSSEWWAQDFRATPSYVASLIGRAPCRKNYDIEKHGPAWQIRMARNRAKITAIDRELGRLRNEEKTAESGATFGMVYTTNGDVVCRTYHEGPTAVLERDAEGRPTKTRTSGKWKNLTPRRLSREEKAVKDLRASEEFQRLSPEDQKHWLWRIRREGKKRR